MTIKERLLKIKQVFDQVSQDDIVAPTAYTLADGSQVMIDVLSVGGIVTKDGAPLAAGDYALTDGTTFTVDATGAITAIVPIEAPEETQFAGTDYTLADGSTVSIDKLEVGGVLMINGAPAPALDYTLADGTIVTVDATGTITNVVAPAPVEMKTPEQMRAAYTKFAAGTPEERLVNLEAVAKATMEYCFGWQIQEAERAATTATAINVYKQGFEKAEKENKELRSTLSEILELMTEFGEIAKEDPPKPSKKVFSHQGGETPKEKALARFAAAAQKLNEEKNPKK